MGAAIPAKAAGCSLLKVCSLLAEIRLTRTRPCPPQGKRYMLPNTTMMLHHPSGVARGQASDIQVRNPKP